MNDYRPEIHLLVQRLENGCHIGEALLFPGTRLFRSNPRRLTSLLCQEARRTVESLPLGKIHQRHSVPELHKNRATVTLEPPSNQGTWLTPLELTFDYVSWSQAEFGHVARVPALGIEVVAGNDNDLQALVLDHIEFALMRRQIAKPCFELINTQRSRKLFVVKAPGNVQSVAEFALPTPKQHAIKELQSEGEQEGRTVLRQVTRPLKDAVASTGVYKLDDAIKHIADALAAVPPLSVLLVGPSGAGKTAAVSELVRRRSAMQLTETQFFATSGSRLVAGMSGFGMWQERCARLVRELSRVNGVLHVGNLIELIEVGRSEHNSQGIAGFLKPYILRGELLVIAECAEGQLPLVERAHLLEAFRKVDVPCPNAEQTAHILASVAEDLGRSRRIKLSSDGLQTLTQLHKRYAIYSANPGRPIRFLRNLIRDTQADSIVDSERITGAFTQETGLPRFMLDDAMPLDLEETRQWFAQRVIGQGRAVGEVVDVLGRVKARLTRPGRPIASLLFIGPTGVGKTEMAKTLAEFLFRDRGRMIRIDMSEYADPAAAARLIEGTLEGEGVLTAHVRDEPFSVVLLDEFEKANASVFDLLLQVLGEGRLTDARGRLADFTNVVLIMTSNLGAASFQHGAIGFASGADEQQRATNHFTESVRSFLRPEMFNRLDAIVPFAPMDESTALSVVRREVDLVMRRDGVAHRGLKLEISDEVLRGLARLGFDPLYGARPLKRCIERSLLALLAEALNDEPDDRMLSASVEIDGDTLHAETQVPLDANGQPLKRDELGASAMQIIGQSQKLRRTLSNVNTCEALLDTRNQEFRIERSWHRNLGYGKRQRRRQLEPMGPPPKRLQRMRELLRRFGDLYEEACGLEEEVLMSILEKKPKEVGVVGFQIDLVQQQFEKWAMDYYGLDFEYPDRLGLAIHSDKPDYLRLLVRAYQEAMPHRAPIQFFRTEFTGGPRRQSDISAFLTSETDERKVLLTCEAPMIGVRFAGESGEQRFVKDGTNYYCSVQVFTGTAQDYGPPRRSSRQTLGHCRRSYLLGSNRLEDNTYQTVERWTGRKIGDAIRNICDQEMKKEALKKIAQWNSTYQSTSKRK